jgi:anaerobic magnesium-protoporphyrin IX monomethyl ester cyclase
MKIGFIRLSDQQLYEKQVTVIEPLGLEYVMSNLGFESDIVFWDLNLGEIFEKYEDCNFICITIPTSLYNQAKQIIKKIHNTCEAKVIVGGPHPSINPTECLFDLGADFVVRGEGEGTIQKIIENQSLVGTINSNCEPLDINSIKFPKRVNVGKYKLDLDNYKNQVVASVITSRSCPYPCTFCSSKKIFGNKIRLRSVENIFEELVELKNTGYNTIIFLDDAFTFNRKRTIELCKKIEPLNFRWWIDTRVDKIDQELLECMKKAGCAFIVYGIESGNEEILKRIKKGIDLETIRSAIKMTKDVGIKCKANLMLGHYKETLKQMTDTIKLGFELQADKTSFYQVIPLPGTELFEHIKLKNTTEYDRFKWYGNNIPVICDPSITSEKLKLVQEMAYEFMKG